MDTTPKTVEEEAWEMHADIEEFWNEDQWNLDEDPPRKDTYEEKLQIWENIKEGWKNPQYTPQDEVRYP